MVDNQEYVVTKRNGTNKSGINVDNPEYEIDETNGINKSGINSVWYVWNCFVYELPFG
jgi:hypothetical protein